MEGKGIVGVFDSGVGGITVLTELVKQLPSYSYIYFADTANCPYGPKKKEDIIRLSKTITDFLIRNGASIIVVACNTATASAIDYLREKFNIPFVGMEPAVKPAALATKTNSIGVLATAGTFNGRLYKETSQKYAANINVNYQVGEGLVELVEQQKANSEEAEKLLKKYVDPMINDNIDHLVLGCTHYPFFIPLLLKLLPNNVSIINPAPAVAKQTMRLINEWGINSGRENKNNIDFYSSGDIGILKNLVGKIDHQIGFDQYSISFTGRISL
jgi:glutamate racemase